MINTFQNIFWATKIRSIPLDIWGEKMRLFIKGKNMGWSYTSPQLHLKIEYKDLMPLKIFKEERKRRAG